jgi:type IV pilus assembly protein PilN
MIEINLIPASGKKRPARAKPVDLGAVVSDVSGRVRDRFLIGAVAVVVLSACGVGVLYVRQTERGQTLTERRDVALADSTRYASVLKDRYRAESTRDSLLRQVNLIMALDEDRYVWPHVMDEVSRALPQYTWITTLTFTGAPQGGSNSVIAPKSADTSAKKKSGPQKRVDTSIPKDAIAIRVQGRTVDLQAVTRFMRDLEASPFFAAVVLEKSESVTDGGKEVAQFLLTFGYSRPDTLLLRRTPLSPSVR